MSHCTILFVLVVRIAFSQELVFSDRIDRHENYVSSDFPPSALRYVIIREDYSPGSIEKVVLESNEGKMVVYSSVASELDLEERTFVLRLPGIYEGISRVEIH